MFYVIRLFVFLSTYALISNLHVYGYSDSELRCSSHLDCSLLKNSSCDFRTYTCRCNRTDEFPYPIGFTFVCLKGARVLDKCLYSKECQLFDKNTICRRDHICTCNSGYHLLKDTRLCVRARSFDSSFERIADFSDEDDSDEDDDDEYRNSYENDFVVPIIVGIVLGSLILCCWSFAICKLYLKKLKRQRARSRRIRIVKQNFRYEDETNTRVPESSGRVLPISSLYSLVPFSRDSSSDTRISQSHNDLDADFAATPNVPLDNIPFLTTPSAIPVISPNEEPLPGYEGSHSKESIAEPPPSYDEVMRENRRDNEEMNVV